MRRHANRLFPRPLRGLQDRPNAAGFASRLGVRAFVLFFGVVSLMPSRAEAETDDSSWILYGNPEFLSVYAHTGKGNFSSTELTGPRVAANQLVQNGDLGTEVEAPNRSREIIASALVGGTFGFLTPAVIVPSRPRLFLDVNVAMPATTEVQLARSGDPGKLSFPDGGGTSGVLVTEGALVGRGTAITVQHQGPQVHAGLGVSFELPLDDERSIRFKPSAVYSRTVIDVSALTVRGVRLNTDRDTNQSLEDDFRQIRLSDARTEVYHAAGPSLEIEYVPGIDWGPFSLSVYGRGHASYILTDPVTRMQQCNVEGGQPGECADWKYTQDRWAYRASVGFHINWTPRPLW
jgi:hypothetical protein